MLVKATGKKVATKVIKAMPKQMAEKLDGKSINEAIEEGLITNIGNDKGGLIFKNKTVDKHYALINGFAIQTSEKVGDGTGEPDLGELVFHTGLSQEKYLNGEESDDKNADYVFWARLGRVQGLNLEDEATATFVAGVE